MGHGYCPNCRLKSVAQVRQVNVMVLVVGSDTLWIMGDASLLQALLHSNPVLQTASPIFIFFK